MKNERPEYDYSIKKESWYKEYQKSRRRDSWLEVLTVVVGLVVISLITYIIR